MINQELIHEQTGGIYSHVGPEIIEGTPEWYAFQSADDPVLFGFVYIESKLEREQRLAEALLLQNPLNP